MITIGSWNDLEKYGIDVLTGEACAYGYRLLCDITAPGKKLVEDCLGIEGVTLNPPWNSKGIGSIMLSHDMLAPLGVFACWRMNCQKVYITHDGKVFGIQGSDKPEDVENWVKWNQGTFCEECRRYGKGGGIMTTYRNPGFSRNEHAMSGRTV